MLSQYQMYVYVYAHQYPNVPVLKIIFQADKRKEAMVNLTRHPGFRASHPREEHFIPLYVAAGAGEGGNVRIVTSLYGAPTFAFGVNKE